MKGKQLIFFILFLAITHYFHYKLNRIRQPFYNTIFSVPDLPKKFYKVNIGDSRSFVESQIGQPFSDVDKNRFDYSKRGNELLFKNKCVYFQLEYHNDTVSWKNVFFDD